MNQAGAIDNNINKIILYITIIFAITGSALLSFDVRAITLSPFRILVAILWFVFLIGILIGQSRLDFSQIKVKYYVWFLGVWFLYAVISLSWAGSRAYAAKNIMLLFVGLSVIFFAVIDLTELKDLKRFYYILLFMLPVILSLGYWNMLTGKQFFAHPEISASVRTAYMHIPRATFFNQNDYATYLALSIPFILAFFKNSKNRLMGFLVLAIMLPTLHQLLLTTSRSNYIAVFLGGVFWFLFILKRKEKLVALAVAGLMLLLLFITVPNYIERASGIVEQRMVGMVHSTRPTNDTYDVRLNLIKNCLVFLKRSHGFGVGAGNVEYHMAKHHVYDNQGILDAHNWWVEIATNYGVFIFIGYVIFYLGLIINLWRAYLKLEDPLEKMMGESLLVGLIMFPAASISSSSLIGFGPQWVLFALALSFLNYNINKRETVYLKESLTSEALER